MVKRMLIDTAHPEETRIAVVSGSRLDEFDVETSTKRSLKGNIYLAKVTRVEPSLQAAFVDFGGNRHGFLAFSEIHPDYYQIPVSDRKEKGKAASADNDAADPAAGENGDGESEDDTGDGVEVVGGDALEEIEEIRPPRSRPDRRYKIQEVIKKRQILLVQVTKEERGTKGAALTTYLSLAGRYCVLMPNTARGGGISRKVTNPGDRKRLKAIMEELELPEGIAIILRTAGVARSKAEIRRDYDYLLRRWTEIREATLKATAPSLIYEEGDIVKRAIRDLYTNEITEVIVEGEAGYKTAKDFMKMLIPSHAKRVKRHKEETVPLFHHYQVESQIDNIHSPTVRLKSGGYIVIDIAEALVAIDVNSGRSTRERNIEETAYRTNLEAAEEVARQLRLRDLAGLIVVDFIDMDEARNNANVEKRMKEAMRSDRARIQVGRISAFGLLELSRQRLRPSVLEASTERCPNCGGTGVIRSTESTVLHVLRHIEDEAIRRTRGDALEVFVPTGVAFYILNRKRATLSDIENRYGLSFRLSADDSLIPPDMRIETLAPEEGGEPATVRATEKMAAEDESETKEHDRRRPRRRKTKDAEEPEALPVEAEAEKGETDESTAPSKRRRRGKRGGRRRGRRTTPDIDAETTESEERAAAAESEPDRAAESGEEEAKAPARKTRTSRSPRRPRTAEAETADTEAGSEAGPVVEPTAEADAGDTAPPKTRVRAKARARAKPRKTASRRVVVAGNGAEAAADSEAGAEASGDGAAKGNGKGTRRRRKKPTKDSETVETIAEPPAPVAAKPAATEAAQGAGSGDTEALATTEDKPRRGWWR